MKSCLRTLPAVALLVLGLFALPAVGDSGPVVAIVKGQDANVMVAQAIEMIGGLQDIVHDGQNVVIKPNLTCLRDGKYCPGMTTDVRVVRALVDCLDRTVKCKLTIAEGCGDAKTIFEKCGYTEYAKARDIKMVDLAEDRRVPVKVDGLAAKEYQYPVTIKEADVLVDVPILKTHQLSGVTVGMKNLFGLLTVPRAVFHTDVEKVLPDLVQIRKPDLVLVDGLVGMEGQGPIWGPAVKMDLIVAGRDVVAVDAVCAAIMGADPNRVMHVQNAAAKGLGVADLGKITIKGSKIDEVKRTFVPARWFVGVELPRNEKLDKKIVELADSVVEHGGRRGVTEATFKPERLKVNKEKYPSRESYGFLAIVANDSNVVRFDVRYPALYPELRPEVEAEILTWIKDNLSEVSTDKPKFLPYGGS